MSFDAARAAFKVGEVVIAGFELIEDAIGKHGPIPSAALEAARAALRSIRDGLGGATSPQVVLADLETLRERLVADRAAADRALHDKFDSGETE